MNKSKILITIVVVLSVLFIIFQYNEREVLACLSRAFIVPVFTILYFQTIKRKSFYFSMFLILFSITDLSAIFSDYIPYVIDYFVGNGLYIIAYFFLLLEIFKSLDFKYILKNYVFHLIILLGLNIYIIYVLLNIVYPYDDISPEYFVELTYNVVTLILLSVSLLNYFYRDNRKSFMLFIGSLCMVFSEVIQVAYMYISEKNLLIFSSSIFSILAFYFFCCQASLKNKKARNTSLISPEAS